MAPVRGSEGDAELVDRIAVTTGLSTGEARRVIDDVLAWYAETVEDVVRRRHGELQLSGVRNAEAFPRIAAELGRRRGAPPPQSPRPQRPNGYG